MKDLILGTKGKIFCIEFTTVKGEYRKMIARTGVKKSINGKGLRYSTEDKGLICIYKLGKFSSGFRMIKLDNIISIKTQQITYYNN